ncbi:hypothetical protein RJ639_045885 [Escallonia herrerae]|uniref:Pentatricopeptide repeat-containing protein n=1 Tax=Escallonia herrerae TaxID=1293975 RepID=A0AA88W6I8_9ASTE|nr:hypothetical protein RJ639_045885 [Escallonia herrerae]
MSRFATTPRMLALSTRSVTVSPRLNLPTSVPKSLKCHIAFASYAKIHASSYTSTQIDHLKNQGLDSNVYRCTKMIASYVGDHRLGDALNLFDEMPVKDTVVWNLIIKRCLDCGDLDMDALSKCDFVDFCVISGLDQHGRNDEALVPFKHMVGYGVRGTPNTYSCVITACASALALGLGAGIHGHVIKLNYVTDGYIAASMITFYAKCKQIKNSCKIFNEKLHKHVAVWTALLTGYGLNSRHEDALKVFSDMLKMGVLPNQSSFTSAFNSCYAEVAIDPGKVIHAMAIKLRAGD